MWRPRAWIPVLVFAAAALGWATPARAADPCDRACLEKTIDKVLDAMTARDPGRLMLGRRVRYTENGVELRIGDGIWGTATARGRYTLYVSDPEAGQAGFYGTIDENGAMHYLALRVRVYEGLIQEIEAVVARGPSGAAGPGVPLAGEAMDRRQPRPQFLQAVPATERMTRERLVEVANSYFTGLANQTGGFVAPFAPTCERWENGLQTTGQAPNPKIPAGGIDILAMGCEAQQKSGWFAFVTDIRDRRFPVVDVERGLVLSFAFFDHNGAVRSYRLPDGRTSPNPVREPNTIEISELFQVRGGRIDQIEAVINTAPYGMRSDAWDR